MTTFIIIAASSIFVELIVEIVLNYMTGYIACNCCCCCTRTLTCAKGYYQNRLFLSRKLVPIQYQIVYSILFTINFVVVFALTICFMFYNLALVISFIILLNVTNAFKFLSQMKIRFIILKQIYFINLRYRTNDLLSPSSSLYLRSHPPS